MLMGILMAQWAKNSPAIPETQEMQVWALGQEDVQRKKWQLTPVFLPGKCHRQRSLAGYSPWGRKEVGMTEHMAWYTNYMALQYEASAG